jgi:hypothetical protein
MKDEGRESTFVFDNAPDADHATAEGARLPVSSHVFS